MITPKTPLFVKTVLQCTVKGAILPRDVLTAELFVANIVAVGAAGIVLTHFVNAWLEQIIRFAKNAAHHFSQI